MVNGLIDDLPSPTNANESILTHLTWHLRGFSPFNPLTLLSPWGATVMVSPCILHYWHSLATQNERITRRFALHKPWNSSHQLGRTVTSVLPISVNPLVSLVFICELVLVFNRFWMPIKHSTCMAQRFDENTVLCLGNQCESWYEGKSESNLLESTHIDSPHLTIIIMIVSYHYLAWMGAGHHPLVLLDYWPQNSDCWACQGLHLLPRHQMQS